MCQFAKTHFGHWANTVVCLGVVICFFGVEYRAWGQPPAKDVPVESGFEELTDQIEDLTGGGHDVGAEHQVRLGFLEVMRGLIQNELTIVGELCELTPEQTQSLVDLAEREWESKSSSSITKCTQQHMFGIVDLDGLAERLTKGWLQLSAKEKVPPYEQELAARMLHRKQALISRVLDAMETKLHLTAAQIQKIEEVLNREWRDRWFRSLEATFAHSALHPEIRLRWIEAILTNAQQAALASRESQPVFSVFQVTADSPSLSLKTRFSIGNVKSSEDILVGIQPMPESRRRIRDALELAPAVEDGINVQILK